MNIRPICLLGAFLMVMLPSPFTPAASNLDNETYPADSLNVLPDNLGPAMESLLAFVNQPTAEGITGLNGIDPILSFVTQTPKKLGTAFSLGQRNGAVSDYFEFTVKKSLKEMLDYVYHPDIPSYLTLPASLRRSHWIELNGGNHPFPDLSAQLNDLKNPLVIRGIEFIENTPDTYSGAYYAYELERALILMRHNGHPLLISISIQPQKSSVGKKGLVLGPDDNWNYLYTGEKGCTLSGLGWADSYMYHSASIMVYYQVSESNPSVKCGVFKWLKAGWGGINLVKPHHIRKGIERFADNFITILESPRLPQPAELTQVVDQINMLTLEQLREKNRTYVKALQSQYLDKTSSTYQNLMKRHFSDDAYLAEMNREELQAVVYLDYLKYLMGRDHSIDPGDIATSAGLKKKPS